MENQNRQVRLKRRPTGAPATDDFEIVDAPMPDPADRGCWCAASTFRSIPICAAA